MTDEPRLTTLAHGGGCGCKLAPSVLSDLLAGQPALTPVRALLVGNEHGDDAAVWQIDDQTCIIATTDFFMPMVDDPFDFGRIAATNAISDVYAMGGKPIFALAILGMPVAKLSVASIRDILRGGSEVCASVGVPIVGGHSIDSPEPIYGLAVIGTCHPRNVRRNGDAKPGDRIILTKPIGVGIYSAAFKKDALPTALYREFIDTTTRVNTLGAALSDIDGVHAVTDVTGFGLAGHALEIARASQANVVIDEGAVPLLSYAARLAQQGFVTGASARNWASYHADIETLYELPEYRRHLLADPQTSGGLLISCCPKAAELILEKAHQMGFADATVIGMVEGGAGKLVIRNATRETGHEARSA